MLSSVVAPGSVASCLICVLCVPSSVVGHSCHTRRRTPAPERLSKVDEWCRRDCSTPALAVCMHRSTTAPTPRFFIHCPSCSCLSTHVVHVHICPDDVSSDDGSFRKERSSPRLLPGRWGTAQRDDSSLGEGICAGHSCAASSLWPRTCPSTGCRHADGGRVATPPATERCDTRSMGCSGWSVYAGEAAEDALTESKAELMVLALSLRSGHRRWCQWQVVSQVRTTPCMWAMTCVAQGTKLIRTRADLTHVRDDAVPLSLA